jgi:Chaperone of endosialidase
MLCALPTSAKRSRHSKTRAKRPKHTRTSAKRAKGPDTPDPGPLPATNTGDGQGALQSLTTGIYNSAFGIFSLLSLTDGNFCTGVGAGALLSNSASENTAVGAGALLSTTGGNNTAVGAFALSNNVTGIEHTAVGRHALLNNTGAVDNTAVGLFALLNNVDGNSNTAVGAAALRDNVSGNDNQAIGRGALRLTTGSGNIGIGREAAANMTASNNVICIGSPGDATVPDAADRTYIGNIRGVVVGNVDGIPVIVDSDGQLGTSNSSARFKKDIKPMDHKVSEAILALKPVTFHYKNPDTRKAGDTPQFGLIAEDVAEVNRDLVVCDANGEPLTVRYEAVNVMLLNEFLKEHKKVEEQQTNITQLNSKMANQAAIIAQQQKGMESLTAQLKEQAAQIQKVSAQLELSKSAPQTVLNDE